MQNLSSLDLTAAFYTLSLEERREVVKANNIQTPWVELPVDLTTFIQDEYYLGHPPLSQIQYEFVLAMTDIFTTTGEWKEFQYVEAVIEWGKGSGKDTCACIIMARLLYVFSCLADPLATCNLAPQTSIDFLNVATDAPQALANFFAPLKKLIVASPWFTKAGAIIRTGAIHMPPIIGHDKKRGDLGAFNCWSGNSNEEGMEGLPGLFLVVLDEIDAFHQPASVGAKKVRDGPSTSNKVYDMATTSVQSRHPGRGKVILISWPRSQSGFIKSKMKEGQRYEEVYTSGPHHTWDANPRLFREDFALEFARHPELASAKYECNPPLEVVAPLFRVQDIILRLFHAALVDVDEMTPSVELQDIMLGTGMIPVRDEDNPGPEPCVAPEGILEGNVMPKPDPRSLYVWHVDTGLTRDSGAAVMSHPVGWEENEEGVFVPLISVDLMAIWDAPVDREIDLGAIRQFILMVTKLGYPCRLVTFDKFASAYIKQELGQYGRTGRRIAVRPASTKERDQYQLIETKLDSVDRNRVAYDTLFDVCVNGRLRTFFHARLIRELLRLQDLGYKIDHPPGGSKDIADAVAGSVRNAVNIAGEVLPVARRQRMDARQMHGVPGWKDSDRKPTPAAGGFDASDVFARPSGGRRSTRRSSNPRAGGLLYKDD